MTTFPLFRDSRGFSSSASNELTKIPHDFGSLGPSSNNILAKTLLGRRSRGGIHDLGMVETPGISTESISEMDGMNLDTDEKRDNILAEEVKRMKMGRRRLSVIGRTGEINVTSQTKAERGGEAEASREGRRQQERRIASNWRKKGSSEFAVEASKGRR